LKFVPERWKVIGIEVIGRADVEQKEKVLLYLVNVKSICEGVRIGLGYRLISE
jgi:hypothetical protein